MIQPGDTAPDSEIRTGAGTSLSLGDLRGRCVAVFLLGRAESAVVAELCTVLAEHTPRLLALEVSPIVVLSDIAQQLGKSPLPEAAPYLITEDQHLSLHQQFQGVEGMNAGVWLIDENSVIADVIPTLPPGELVRLCVKRAIRALAAAGDAK